MLDPEFIEIVTGTQLEKPPTDWASHGAEALLDGKEKVFVGHEYDDYEIGIYQQEGWKFKKLHSIRSLADWNRFRSRLKFVNLDSQGLDSLHWFLYDMDSDARKGKIKARGWLDPEFDDFESKRDL